MTGRLYKVPLEQMPPLIESTGLPAAAASGTIYRMLANSPIRLNVVSARIQTLIRRNSLPHWLRELIIKRIGWASRPVYEFPLEDAVTAWPPDGVRPTTVKD